MSATMGAVAGIGLALYAGHHVGDYWVQTDPQAQDKGLPGAAGTLACLRHVATYTAAQAACVGALLLVTGYRPSWAGLLAGLAVSGVTHYLADRREHGLMFWLARRLPSTMGFLDLGKPQRRAHLGKTVDGTMVKVDITDAPTLGTGAWALDQSWHIFWGVFVAALVMVSLS